MHGGVRRNTFEIAQLINAKPQRDDNVFVERVDGAFAVVMNQMVELILNTERAKNKLMRETGIAMAEMSRGVSEQVGSVTAGAYFFENKESGLTGRSDGDGSDL